MAIRNSGLRYIYDEILKDGIIMSEVQNERGLSYVSHVRTNLYSLEVFVYTSDNQVLNLSSFDKYKENAGIKILSRLNALLHSVELGYNQRVYDGWIGTFDGENIEQNCSYSDFFKFRTDGDKIAFLELLDKLSLDTKMLLP